MQRTALSLVSVVKLLLIAGLFALVSIILGAASAQASEQESSGGLSLGSLESVTESLDEVAPLPGNGSPLAETEPVQSAASTGAQSAQASETTDNDGLLASGAKPLSNLGDESVEAVINEVGASVSSATEVVGAPANTIVEQAAEPVSTVTEQVGHLAEQAAEPVSTVTEVVANTTTAVVAPAPELLSNATGTVTAPVAELVSETTGTITGTVGDVANEVPVVGVIADPVEDVISTLPVEGTNENDRTVTPVPAVEQLPETSIDAQPESSTSEAPAAPIFDPEFPATEASGKVPTVPNLRGLSNTFSADEHHGAAASTTTDTGVPSPSAPAASPAPSAPAGSTLRSSADSGSSGGAPAADLPGGYFSLQASGLKAALAESSNLPGSLALEHGFSPD